MREITNDDLKKVIRRVRGFDVGRLRLRRDRSLVETAAVLGYLGAVATHVLNRFQLAATVDQVKDNTALSKTRIMGIARNLEAKGLVRMENGGVLTFVGLTPSGKRLYLQALREARRTVRPRVRSRA